MATLYQAVRVIAVYLLFVSVLLGILQDSPFKIYVRLFAGLLLVLLMVRAVFPFLFTDFNMETMINFDSVDFSERLEEAQKAGEDKIREQVLQGCMQKVEGLLESFGYTVQDMELELGEEYQMEVMELVLMEKEENSMELEQVKAALAEYFSVDSESIGIRISD